MRPNQSQIIFRYFTILVLLFGFTLRADYLRQSHPYVDEYFTIVAAQATQQQGYPRLPSGLFYSHGFLYTYVVAAVGWIMNIAASSARIVPAEMVYRVPNLLISAGAMAALAAVTRRWFGGQAALIALALMAIYPHGIVWGARVRMYTLVFLLVPLLVYAVYQTAMWPRDKRWYGLAIVLLALGLFSHNLLNVFVPLLVVGVVLIGWRANRSIIKQWRWWLPGLFLIGLVVALSAYLQSLWLVVPETASQDRGWPGILDAILERLNPVAAIANDGNLIDQFVWNNHFNLLIIALVISGSIGFWPLFIAYQGQTPSRRYFWPMIFLYWLIIGGMVEFMFLLEPGLKQPRYVAPFLLLAFIILGGWTELALNWMCCRFKWQKAWKRQLTIVFVLALLLGLWPLSTRQIPKIFYEGLPAVGYNRAFQYIQINAQPDEAVLSPLPAAAWLYLHNPNYFAAQNATQTFVHVNRQGILADRWVGAPWLYTAQQLKDVLLTFPRVWLVIDQLSLESQFNSDWKQLMRHNTAEVWAEDGVVIYRAEGLIADLPTVPETVLDVQLGSNVKLVGYSRSISPPDLRLTLFWQVLAPLPDDYTTFVHVRNQRGETIAQIDVQPLAGTYPTSRWKVGETVVDQLAVPLPAHLSPGTYSLLLGLYRWDTLERLSVINDTTGENAVKLESIAVP